ncbi:MAG TPA: TlpA disulfide reductase family protein [Candidatus Latescibacteria bacterium]|nr:TlpA disulfide reductase family protein [Candidatus Latescibacterota bacterium]
MKTLSKIAVAVAAIILLNSPSFATLKAGDKFIPFSLKNIDGKDHTVTMEEGKLTLIVTETVGGETRVTKSHPDGVLVDFWATWCVPCRKAMPHMQQLNETYKPADGETQGGLRVYGIALDEAGSKVVKPFYQKLKITYPILADPPSSASPEGVASTAKDMKKKYEVQEIPVVYLIDSSGTITHVHVGFKEEHIAELDKAVNALLGGGKQ